MEIEKAEIFLKNMEKKKSGNIEESIIFPIEDILEEKFSPKVFISGKNDPKFLNSLERDKEKLNQNNFNILEKEEFIQQLSLNFNNFDLIPKTIINLSKLKEISMNNNRITKIPFELFIYLRGLRKLSLNNNKISILPKEISHMQELKYFDISYNEILEIPVEIGNCKNLETLLINNNSFKCLPCSISNLKKLQNFGLEWFLYISSFINSKVINSKKNNNFFNNFFSLCKETMKNKVIFVGFEQFLFSLSQINFDLTIIYGDKKRSLMQRAIVDCDFSIVENLGLTFPIMFSMEDADINTCLHINFCHFDKDIESSIKIANLVMNLIL